MPVWRWQMGHWRRAVHDLERALPMLEASDDRASQANTHHYLCLAYADLEEWEPALAHGRQAVALRTGLGLAEGLADLYTDLAAVYLHSGDAGRTAQYLERAAPLWQELGKEDGQARLHLIWGDLHCRQSAWRRAQMAYREASALWEPDRALPRQVTALLGLAHAHLAMEDRAAAQALLPRIEALSGRLARIDLQVRLLWLQAELDPPAATAALDRALALCSPDDTDNDRLRWLGYQTRTRLRVYMHSPPTDDVPSHNLSPP